MHEPEERRSIRNSTRMWILVFYAWILHGRTNYSAALGNSKVINRKGFVYSYRTVRDKSLEARNMRKALLATGLAVVISAALFAAKADFQTGKLLDVTTETRLVDGSSYQWAIFVVQIDDLVYTLRGARLGRIHQSLISLAVN